MCEFKFLQTKGSCNLIGKASGLMNLVSLKWKRGYEFKSHYELSPKVDLGSYGTEEVLQTPQSSRTWDLPSNVDQGVL